MYRKGLEITRCSLGCPIGNLALEIGDGNPALRKKVDKNFRNWCAGVASWLAAASGRLPAGADPGELARFVLVVMEGAVMQARSSRSLEPFDAAVRQLRRYFDSMHAESSASRATIDHRQKRRKK